MRTTALVVLTLAAAFGPAAPGARADVLVVDAAGGQPFTSLPDAVAAAADGDVILVKGGNYPDPVVVSGVGLTVVAEAGATVRQRRLFSVRDLAPGQTVVVRGLQFDAVQGNACLELADNAGQVRVERCSFEPLGDAAGDGFSGATVQFCDAVVFSECSLDGDDGLNGFDAFPVIQEAGDGGPGLFARSSQVALYGCTLTGGRGGSVFDDANLAGGRGGSGVEAVGGAVFLVGCTLVGGPGGSGSCDEEFLTAFCSGGGDGGHGLLARAGCSAVVQDLDATPAAGGGGGTSIDFPEQSAGPGADGQPTAVVAGATLTSYGNAPARRFAVSSPVREGGVAQLLFEGQPGDAVSVWGSLTAADLDLPPFQGHFLLGFPLLLPTGVPLGIADATGQLQQAVPLGELGPGIEGFTAFFQVTYVASGGPLRLGPSSASSFLDGGF